MNTIMKALNEIRLKFTGLQKNKALWDYYLEHSAQINFEEIEVLMGELSRYRYIHDYNDLAVRDSMIEDYFKREKERMAAFKVVEILFLLSDGLKRNQLLVDYVNNYPGRFSNREIHLLQEAIYIYPHDDEFNDAQTRNKILERVI